jgi:predicted DCC family thiol-disulfide oxidoreductase YuxK
MKTPAETPDSVCDTLYYDGACPLCNAEVKRLRDLADSRLQLVDVHEIASGGVAELSERKPEGAAERGGAPAGADLPGRVALLRNLHYRRSDGTLLSGLDANVAAWQHTRLGPLWRWLRWPLIRPFADRLYSLWAERRYRRLYHEDGRRRED